MAEEDKKPKIIIDEDWKSKVDREREEARKTSPQPAATGKEGAAPEEAELTHFDFLVSTLAAQAVAALGLVQQEGQTQVYVDIGAARHLIDSLMMLREKTKGNLTADEQANLDEAISELQRVFAVRATQVREAALNRSAGGTPPNLKPGST